MLLLNRDALEAFRFCSLSCHHVAEHEAILLSLIGRAGRDKVHDVRDTLALIIEEDSIGDLLQSLVELARAMTSATMLPGPPAPPRA